ncbi:MAG: hypothetical protein ACW98D_00950 [Promethearchaeota archaeon]|jgi:ribosomal protein S27E
MAKKSRSQEDIQGLLIFTHKERPKKKKPDKYIVEKSNKEEKITTINSLTTQGVHYRYTIILNNEKSASITNINIKVSYPAFLTYTGSYPLPLIISSQFEDNSDKINIINLILKGLKAGSSLQIYLHFTPSTQLGNGEFETFLKFNNNKGKEKKINSNPIPIQIDNILITPKIISHARIREFSQITGMKRAVLSLGIGTKKKLNYNKIYDIFENLILSYNFQLITKDKEKGILWVFGSELNSNSDIFAICKIGSKIIEIIAHSINPVVLGSFLFSLDKKLRKQLLINKIIKPNVKIFDLECINCGAYLPYFPKRSESITCMICSHKQIVW